MPSAETFRAVRRLLFGKPDAHAYVVLDGASVPDLVDRLARDKPEHWCLFPGELAPDMAEVAPYMVRLEPESPLERWVIEEGWGRHWGIFAVTPADLRRMRAHWRQFMMVEAPDGRALYFRFYDPRVLAVYLPTCNGEETERFFGPVEAYVMESSEEKDSVLVFRPGPNAPVGQVVRCRPAVETGPGGGS
jgi:hypothetical protein